jgi:glutathione transport system permease protein
MTGSLAKTVLTLPAILLLVSGLIFLAVRLLPGDPARMLAGPEASAATVARLHDALGLNQPLWIQYGQFLARAARGDLGVSIATRRPVSEELGSHAPYTLVLGVCAYLLAAVLGVAGGVLAAARRGGAFDTVFMGVTMLSVSVANFWFGLMAMELFAVRLQWLPLMGAGSPAHLVLPVLTLALAPLGLIGRLTRASLIEALAADYVRTARAKGLGPFAVHVGHALRTAMTPIITIVGLNVGSLVAGAVVTETLFGWPGLGQLLVSAVRDRDYPVVQGVALLAVASVVLSNMAAELLIALLDPRVRAGLS